MQHRHGGVGARRARLEQLGQQAVELQLGDDPLGQAQVARALVDGVQLLPQRRRDAAQGGQEGEPDHDAAHHARQRRGEQRQHADDDVDQALEHAPRARLHVERDLCEHGR
jgi:hypothetical protein